MAGRQRSFSSLRPLMEGGTEPFVQDKGRVCATHGCGTVLSIYNGSVFCWQHNPDRVYSLPGPQGRSRPERMGREFTIGPTSGTARKATPRARL